jgi:hypothetical protein
MRASAARTLQELSVFGFKNGQAGVEQLALGHDDHVVAGRDFVQTENLSYQSFRSISLDRATDLPRGGDAKPAGRGLGREKEQGAEPAVHLDPVFVNLLKLRAAANPLVALQQAAIFRC